MTLPQLKSAIETLSDEERVDLCSWLRERDEQQQDIWDAELERDAQPGGRLEAFIARADIQIAEGKTKPLDEILRDF